MSEKDGEQTWLERIPVVGWIYSWVVGLLGLKKK